MSGLLFLHLSLSGITFPLRASLQKFPEKQPLLFFPMLNQKEELAVVISTVGYGQHPQVPPALSDP